MKKLFYSLTLAIALLFGHEASAAVDNIDVNGWFESGFVTWAKAEGYSYNVYVASASGSSWTQLDAELVREYPNFGRADAVGLKAGDYRFKVVPVKDGKEVISEATETGIFTAKAHDRGGFAHFKSPSASFNPANGIGAYKNDGTLKAGAKVIYVTADNAKTITTSVKTGSKDTNMTECTGLQTIIDAYQKGYDKTPIAFRVIGTLRAEDMDKFSSSAEGLQIKGKEAYSELNITIEGIGNDATIHGFGFLLRNAASVELRNFAIMWCMDDAVSMDTDNSNLWIHNLDLFYGKPGSDADQKKGDGTLDIKGDSKYCTMSYNHLWDSGKASLCGMTSETGPNYITYHHNWFDHSDSRHPRIRTMSVHVYNNYYDGNSKYGVGSTTGSDVFVENNYFRNCKYPMLISKQGSDVHNGVGTSDETKGTFSGEEGGSIKAYGNFMTGQKSFEPYKAGDATYSKHFDAYVVNNRNETVPADVASLLGGNTYSNFDTDPTLFYSNYHCDAAEDVPSIATGTYGAGRCEHGDFLWTFGSSEDSNDAVIPALSTALQNYKTSLIGFFGNAINGSGNDNEGDDNTGDNGGNTGGNDSGDTEITNAKEYTLASMFSTSSATVSGTSFTIDGAYIAGAASSTTFSVGETSDKGAKLRVTGTGKGEKALVINVNEGFVINALTMVADRNDTDKGAVIDGIYVDGSNVNILTAPVTLNAKKGTPATISASNITATQNIKITFASTTTSTQYNALIEFIYSKPSTGSATEVYGDVNNDGVVDVSDVNAIISVICGQ